MKVFEIQNGYGLDHVAMAEREVPVPGPGEVLVKMRAVSLNSRDLGVIDGFYYPDRSSRSSRFLTALARSSRLEREQRGFGSVTG